MSLVTVSQKRRRVYPRRFDHEEMRRLRGEGWTQRALADKYGVSVSRIQQLLNPELEKYVRDRALKSLRRKRQPCEGGCGKLVWTNRPTKTGFCPTCYGRFVRAKSVGDTTLLCSNCEQWKHDDEFPGRKRAKSRRGRSPICRSCQAAVRQVFREKRKVPCTRCGKPRTHPKDNGEGVGRHNTGLCRSCFLDSVRAA